VVDSGLPPFLVIFFFFALAETPELFCAEMLSAFSWLQTIFKSDFFRHKGLGRRRLGVYMTQQSTELLLLQHSPTSSSNTHYNLLLQHSL
jgi:hypothetical protein